MGCFLISVFDGVQHPMASFFIEKTSRSITDLKRVSFSPSLLSAPKSCREAECCREWDWFQGGLCLEKSQWSLTQRFRHAEDLLSCRKMLRSA